jgi:ATP-binding cassette subfamily B protein
MKLLFELPKLERDIVQTAIGTEAVLYCTPYDLSSDGRFTEGWVVITCKQLLCIEKEGITRQMDISNATEYKAEMLVGNGILTAAAGNGTIIIARYSSRHVPRYAYIARVLNDILKKREV